MDELLAVIAEMQATAEAQLADLRAIRSAVFGAPGYDPWQDKALLCAGCGCPSCECEPKEREEEEGDDGDRSG
jgi:hypothetical protein